MRHGGTDSQGGRPSIAELIASDLMAEGVARFASHVDSSPPEIKAVINDPAFRALLEQVFASGYAEGMTRGREFERHLTSKIRESN